jgi:predicted lipoprotein with Yx(FWY)xxD motif
VKAWLVGGVVGLGLAFATAAAAQEDVPAGVNLAKRGHGWLLADARGMTLYTTVLDQQPGKSACNGPCAEQWPPLLAPTDAQPMGDWTLVDRGQSRQWAFRGKPLYTYINDTGPGDTYGDDVAGQWSVAVKPIPTPAGVGISKTLLGHVLADAKGLTLYRSTQDRNGRSSCDAACARSWMPVVAPALAVARGDWTLAVRQDGTRQWSYQGKPLYRYTGDLRPGETSGEGIGKTWQAVVLEPPPPRPEWVTIQGSDGGELFADANGKTLYARNTPRRRSQAVEAGDQQGQVVGPPPPSKRTCGVECPESPWRPVIAADTDKPTGNWSIVKRDDGRRQWAYKGQPLYTHVLDKLPGDFNGIRSGDGRLMGTLMRSGQPMQGTGA